MHVRVGAGVEKGVQKNAHQEECPSGTKPIRNHSF